MERVERETRRIEVGQRTLQRIHEPLSAIEIDVPRFLPIAVDRDPVRHFETTQLLDHHSEPVYMVCRHGLPFRVDGQKTIRKINCHTAPVR